MNIMLFPGPIGLNGYQTLLGGCSDQETLRVSHGNLVRTYTVVNVPTVGPNLHFQLVHNSRDNYLGTLGRNWRHNAMARLTFAGLPVNLVTVTDGTGRPYDFQANVTTGGWDLTADSLFLRKTLTQVGTQWKLSELGDGDTMIFDSDGLLVQIVDAHSNAITFTYSGGLLSTISEPTAGRQIVLTYTGGLLTQILDPNLNPTNLVYDNSNLVSIIGPEGCVLSYGYAPGSTDGLILSRTDPGNNTYTYSYLGDGSLSTLTNPESKTLTYVYDQVLEPNSHPHVGENRLLKRTRLTDAEDQVWDYRFDRFGNLWRILNPLQHCKRLYWSDQQTLLYLSEGYGLNALGSLGPLDSPYNRYTRNLFDSLGNKIAGIDGNGLITQWEYDLNSRLVAVTPGRATLAVGGDWFDHYGKDGFLMCAALDTVSDLWQKPAYVDGAGILPGESDGSNAFERALPDLVNHRLDPRAPWIRMPGSPVRDTYRRTLGQWKNQDGHLSFTFRIPISQTGAFNLSFYTHCADQPYYQDNVSNWELMYAGSFGRDVEILVTDLDPVTGDPRRQKFRMQNTGAGVWITFGLYATAGTEIRVLVRSREINAEQFPVISCIAFDPIENRRSFMTYTGHDLTGVENPLGQSRTMAYNLDGSLQKLTDEKLRDTLFFYLDAAKNLTKIIDANLGEILLTHDNNGNVLTSQDQDLRTTTSFFDGKNRVIKVVDALSNATEFFFSPAGNLIKIRDARLRETVLIYNNLNRLVVIRNSLNQETLLEYNATGRLLKITDPLLRVSQMGYDAAGRRIESQLADGQKVLYALNAVNRLVSITSPNASQTLVEDIDVEGCLNVLDNPGYELESDFAPTAPQRWLFSDDDVDSGYYKPRSNAQAHSGLYSVDALTGKSWRQENVPAYAGGRYLARAWAKKEAAGATTVTASIAGVVRDFQAALEVQNDPGQDTPVDNSWTELKPQRVNVPGDTQALRTQTALAQLQLRCAKTQVSDPNTTVYFDDATLQLLSTCMEFDGENLREVATPDGARFRRDFDRVGRLSILTDPQGRALRFVHDGMDRIVEVHDSLGNSLKYGLDSTGMLVTLQDSRNNVMAFEYDLLDRLVKITFPDLTTEEFQYSPAGDLISYLDNLSRQRTFQYDAVHRLVQVNFLSSGAETLLLAYDEVGNLVQRTERNGDVEIYHRDGLDRLIRCQFIPAVGSLSPAWDLSSELDAVGNRTRLGPTPALYGSAVYGAFNYGTPAPYWSVPAGGIDAMNRLTAFQDSQSNTTNLGYDADGRRKSVSCPNGTLTSARFDIVGKLLGLVTTHSSTELLNLQYAYNLASDRLGLNNDKASYTFHLDQAGRLVQETTNRWVTQHREHLAQGELSGCLIDPDQAQVQLLGVADDFSQLHLDRWNLQVVEGRVVSVFHRVEPQTLGLQVRAKQGVHLLTPAAWTPRVYSDGAPLHAPVGYTPHDLAAVTGLGEIFLLKRPLEGDFDIVLDWDGFDLTNPGTSSPDLMRYPQNGTELVFLVSLPNGTRPCSIGRGWYPFPASVGLPTQNFLRWTYDGAGAGNPSYSAAATEFGGKFRLKRQGTAFSIYYWDVSGSSWVLCFGSVSTYSTEDLQLQIQGISTYQTYRLISLTQNTPTNPDFSTTPAYYTSCLYEAGQSVSWSRIGWHETLPANTDIQFQLAFSNSQNGPWSYIGPDGTAGTFFTTASGETLPATSAFSGRYARFKARLSSTDGLFTPSFGNVHLSFTGAGLLASYCNNFAYDPAGNITSIETVTDAGTTVDDRNPVANPINNLNQIKQRNVGGASWTYSYDLAGNLTGKTDGTSTFTYTWSDENRLERVQGPGGLDVGYTYDTSGRMMTRTSGGVTTRFTWDAWDCVREETGSSVTLYHIPDGMLHSFSLDGVVYQVHSDALGSVRMITDASGAVVARLEYGAWGEEIFVSAIPALANFPYRFVGGLGVRTDAETGLVCMRARHYDKQLQRFVSRDPIGLNGGENLYAYAANNPSNFADPTGEMVTVYYSCIVDCKKFEGSLVFYQIDNTFLAAIKRVIPDHCITFIDFQGHGNFGVIGIDPWDTTGRSGGLYISPDGKSVLLYDKYGQTTDFPELLRDKLAPFATIRLYGCNTAICGERNITKVLSENLPTSSIVGMERTLQMLPFIDFNKFHYNAVPATYRYGNKW